MTVVESYAQEIKRQATLRRRYNRLLVETRDLEALLNDESRDYDERAARVPEYRALLSQLVATLHDITGYSMEDVDKGFTLTTTQGAT